jgi:hypothetical protein
MCTWAHGGRRKMATWWRRRDQAIPIPTVIYVCECDPSRAPTVFLRTETWPIRSIAAVKTHSAGYPASFVTGIQDRCGAGVSAPRNSVGWLGKSFGACAAGERGHHGRHSSGKWTDPRSGQWGPGKYARVGRELLQKGTRDTAPHGHSRSVLGCFDFFSHIYVDSFWFIYTTLDKQTKNGLVRTGLNKWNLLKQESGMTSCVFPPIEYKCRWFLTNLSLILVSNRME